MAVYVWWLTDPTLLIHDFAFKIVVFSSITSILFNMNPLLKYDGYYALAEIVEIPNLRKHSFAYLGYLIRQLLGLPGNKPPGGKREHRVYFTFGVCAFLYAAMIFSIIFSLLRNLLVVNLALAGLGWIILLLLMYILLRKVLKKSTGFFKLAIMDHSGTIRRNLPIIITIFVLLLVVPAAIRIPTAIKGIATLEPYAYSDLTASAPGYVVEMLVDTGDLVEKDQVVAVMYSDSLEIALTVLKGKQNKLRTIAGNAVILGENETADRYYSQLNRLDEEESMLLMRRNGLEVRSPRRGVVLTEHVKDRQFQFFSEGGFLMRIGMVDSLRVRLEASERQLSDLNTGTPVKFKPESDPWSIASGRIVAIDIVGDHRPEEIESVYRVETVVMNTDHNLFPGQSGQIRLYGKRRSLWALLLRKAIQTLRLDFFI
jgi:putative peptide zinc metalloprotease protein